MKYTTLNKIRAHHPCATGWNNLLHSLGKTQPDDEPLSFAQILASNGLEDAIWCLCSTPEFDRESRLFAVDCVRDVQYLINDDGCLNALNVAEKFANGIATEQEIDLARMAKWNGGTANYAAKMTTSFNASHAAWHATLNTVCAAIEYTSLPKFGVFISPLTKIEINSVTRNAAIEKQTALFKQYFC